jgi:aryl-alcohol dehydrogenase-like predicted oxidoreductase
MKLALGTVQFGSDYGISNLDGKTSQSEVDRILDIARAASVTLLDTAPAYGDSEAVLGKAIKGRDFFRIVTKTLVRECGITPNTSEIAACFRESLGYLGVGSVYGLLVHRPDDLLRSGGQALFEAMADLQAEGLVEKIGVSVYDGDQLDRLMDLYPLQMVQLPLNIFDQRLLRSGHLTALKRQGVEIHARSVFLQGLFFIPPADLPEYFQPIRPLLERLRVLSEDQGLSIVQITLAFVNGIREVDAMICGVNNADQLEELIAALRHPVPEDFMDFFDEFALDDPRILDPSRWKLSN